MTSDGDAQRSAGWYPHDTTQDTVRYWDGSEWTDRVAPAAAPDASPVPSKSGKRGLIIAGIATLLVLVVAVVVIGASSNSSKGDRIHQEQCDDYYATYHQTSPGC